MLLKEGLAVRWPDDVERDREEYDGDDVVEKEPVAVRGLGPRLNHRALQPLPQLHPRGYDLASSWENWTAAGILFVDFHL